MSVCGYARTALQLADDYLAEKVTREAVWQWAEELIFSQEWDRLPKDLRDAIHGLWLLHDSEGSWVPGPTEMRRIREDLAKLVLAEGSDETSRCGGNGVEPC